MSFRRIYCFFIYLFLRIFDKKELNLTWNNFINFKVMKKVKILLVLILMMIPFFQGKVNPMPTSSKSGLSTKKADFRMAYQRIIKYEGYYANNTNDHGGETYLGITRRFNPKWLGWRYLDKEKRFKDFPNRELDPMIDHYALDYYLDIWVKEGFSEIKNQRVANYFLDFRVHGCYYAITITKQVLNSLGSKLDLKDPYVNEEMITAINKVDPNKFINALKLRRIQFYTNIVWRDRTQKVFY